MFSASFAVSAVRRFKESIEEPGKSFLNMAAEPKCRRARKFSYASVRSGRDIQLISGMAGSTQPIPTTI
jgi:hypothetical protein